MVLKEWWDHRPICLSHVAEGVLFKENCGSAAVVRATNLVLTQQRNKKKKIMAKLLFSCRPFLVHSICRPATAALMLMSATDMHNLLCL